MTPLGGSRRVNHSFDLCSSVERLTIRGLHGPGLRLCPTTIFGWLMGDLVFGGQRYRLAGYDASEISNFRSRIDKHLERRRGYQALLRLKALIAGARCVHLINITIKPIFPNRQHGVLEA